jgi:8-oxo-dGTP pyrophosphatase MutT (NUDIX family)
MAHMTGPRTVQLQYAALPFRRRADLTIEVMLITSRDTGRWVIPKGWPVPKLTPRNSAAHEAREEGGIVGRIGERPIGRFHYDKRLSDGSSTHCEVEVFALKRANSCGDDDTKISLPASLIVFCTSGCAMVALIAA